VIVVDASTVIEVLLNTTVERTGEIDAARGLEAVEDLARLPIIRYPHDALRHRVWELRHNVTAYDAVYLALAEALDAPLLTRDERLAATPGLAARVELA
jgi:predicted nucleic acid-binding protein